MNEEILEKKKKKKTQANNNSSIAPFHNFFAPKLPGKLEEDKTGGTACAAWWVRTVERESIRELWFLAASVFVTLSYYYFLLLLFSLLILLIFSYYYFLLLLFCCKKMTLFYYF
jgi:hypothetical protein